MSSWRWLPQLIKAYSPGYSNTVIGILVMIPFVIALVVMVLVGISSDRTLERRYHASVPLIMGAIALTVLAAGPTGTVFVSIGLWCLAVSGICCVWGLFWSLPNEFLTGYSAAAGIALINSIGNLGGFVGSYAVGAIRSTTGTFGGALIFLAGSYLTAAVLMLALRTIQVRAVQPVAGS